MNHFTEGFYFWVHDYITASCTCTCIIYMKWINESWTSTVDTGIYCSYLTTSVCKSLFNLNYFNAWNALTFSIIEKYRYRYVLLCIYTKVNISVDLLATKTFILAFVVKCIYLSNPYFTGLKLSRPFTWV